MIVYTGDPKQTDIVYPCLNVWYDDSIYRCISWFLTQHFKMLHCIRMNLHIPLLPDINVAAYACVWHN